MISGNFSGREAEAIAGVELDRAIFENPEPDLGTRQILKDGNRLLGFIRDGPDAAYNGLVCGYGPVGEVEPKGIGAGFHQLAQHLGRLARGTNGANDFCASHFA
jgi:hypothetical protein